MTIYELPQNHLDAVVAALMLDNIPHTATEDTCHVTVSNMQKADPTIIATPILDMVERVAADGETQILFKAK